MCSIVIIIFILFNLKSLVEARCNEGAILETTTIGAVRFQRCQDGRWVGITCSPGEVFKPDFKACVPSGLQKGALMIRQLGNIIKNLPAPPAIIQETHVNITWKRYLPGECGLSGPEWRKKHGEDGGNLGRISHGIPTSLEENPWQVAILDRVSNALKCGGSIISVHHVLTAAHCFKNRVVTKIGDDGHRHHEDKIIPKESRIIVAGVNNLTHAVGINNVKEAGGQQFDILKLFIHVNHSITRKNTDIALIMINGKFEFVQNVYPICLPLITERYRHVYNPKPDNKQLPCRVTGWGKLSSESTKTEDILRYQTVSIVGEEQCAKNNEQSGIKITHAMFCAGDYKHGRADTCHGDSGGPLACREGTKDILFGITSWGVDCGRPEHPGVYVKVRVLMGWIGKRIESSMTNAADKAVTDDEDYNDEYEDEDED